MDGLFGNTGLLDQLANLHGYLGWFDEASDRNMLLKNGLFGHKPMLQKLSRKKIKQFLLTIFCYIINGIGV
jgi:hypothetical protein